VRLKFIQDAVKTSRCSHMRSRRDPMVRAIAMALLVLVAPAVEGHAAAANRRPQFAAPTRGEFVSVCAVSHRAGDDPIVFPNRPGASHSHDFFGNPSTDAMSTTESLAAERTRCSRSGDAAAYWVPTLYQDGKPVMAKVVRAYYRRVTSPATAITPFPFGLRMIAGNARATTPQDLLVSAWACSVDGDEIEVIDVPTCAPGRPLRLRIVFPDCWNGRDLDSPDHKSHMAYSVKSRCPSTHPVPVPRLVLSIRYSTRGGAGVTLASGGAYSGHADFFNAWDPTELNALVSTCLAGSKSCGPGADDAIPDLAPKSLPETVTMLPSNTGSPAIGVTPAAAPATTSAAARSDDAIGRDAPMFCQISAAA